VSADVPSTAIRTVLAEDAVLIRTGIAHLLQDEGFEIVASVGTFDELLAAVRTTRPDLLITDIRMPPSLTDEGLRAAATLRAEFDDLAIMVLSQHVEASAATTLLTGTPTAVGYLLKERVADVSHFIDACRIVAAGGVVIDPTVSKQLLSHQRHRDALAHLTERERDVLDVMATGASNKAIATRVFCSEKTVESHVRSIFQKLDLPEHPDENRRVAAVVRWLQQNR
jgi:DNA-binding NarL/FixJ family response regulator